MSDSLEKELERNRILVQGVMGSSEIKERIAPIYPEEKLAQGVELYTAARNAFHTQVKEVGESRTATRAFNDEKERIHNQVIKIRKTLRYFYKNNLEMEEVLMFNSTVPTNYAQWGDIIRLLVNAIVSHEEVLAKLNLVGISAGEIESLKTDLDTLDELRLIAVKEDGESQIATQNKEASFNELKSYCIDLRECLDLFFEGSERQVLEKVGITVK